MILIIIALHYYIQQYYAYTDAHIGLKKKAIIMLESLIMKQNMLVSY